jgi:CheY-like chemotaxis protein
MTKVKILCVDDEPKFTRMMRFNLEKTGFYKVQEVNDAKQVVETAEQFKPDLIMLDVMMPEMDGGDVDTRLKSHPLLKDVPVIFVTAVVAQSEASRQGCSSGGLLFLAKPVTLDVLIETIETNLRKGSQPTVRPIKPTVTGH